MANRKNVHVVQRDSGWGALREGARRATQVFDTQAQAIQAGRQMARQGQGELLIHGQCRREQSFAELYAKFCRYDLHVERLDLKSGSRWRLVGAQT